LVGNGTVYFAVKTPIDDDSQYGLSNQPDTPRECQPYRRTPREQLFDDVCFPGAGCDGQQRLAPVITHRRVDVNLELYFIVYVVLEILVDVQIFIAAAAVGRITPPGCGRGRRGNGSLQTILFMSP
jgi:hypothetical protein